MRLPVSTSVVTPGLVGVQALSFLRHGQIYRPVSSLFWERAQQGSAAPAPSHRLDESASRLFPGGLLSSRARLCFTGCIYFAPAGWHCKSALATRGSQERMRQRVFGHHRERESSRLSKEHAPRLGQVCGQRADAGNRALWHRRRSGRPKGSRGGSCPPRA